MTNNRISTQYVLQSAAIENDYVSFENHQPKMSGLPEALKFDRLNDAVVFSSAWNIYSFPKKLVTRSVISIEDL